ncbi:hypothetical protein [Streptomyces sp. NPDC101455]|uniref:hypothetical protein n=1 Tax=Streptomyces sp. NPDC101455 TaxID=3366142 RepID=UPI00380FF47D
MPYVRSAQALGDSRAGVHAIDQRVTTGRWGTLATRGALQRSAEALGLDGTAFIPCWPSRPVVRRHNQVCGSGRW